MDCPICKDAMITLELEEVEVDYCLECGGIWLDAGELEQLLGDSNEATAVINSFKVQPRSQERARKCPICLKKMKKIIAGERTPVLLIDQCVKGHGLWFDKGELQDVLKMGSFDKGQKVQRLLAEMFSHNKEMEGE